MTLDPAAAARAIRRGRAITLVGLVLLAGLYVLALQFTPPERFQGLVQKVFYVHPPVAYAMQLAFIMTGLASALYLSLRDYVAWDRGLRAGALLKPSSWAQVFQPVRLTSGATYPYGFGWSVEQIAGQRVQRHGGAWQGFETYIARYLGDDLTIVALTNLSDAEPSAIVAGIAHVFNPALPEKEAEE